MISNPAAIAMSLISAFWAAYPGAEAALPPGSIGYRSAATFSPDPLTTEKLWSLAPSELNPHRLRWALERKVSLAGLSATEAGELIAADVVSETVMHVRGPGPWYSKIEDFGCDPEPSTGFGTLEGARTSAESAARAWNDWVQSHRDRLRVQLSTVKASDSKLAMELGNRIFKAWLFDLNQDWELKLAPQARAQEWNGYVAQARKLGVDKKAPGACARKTPKDRMETPSQVARTEVKARLPAKRWAGLYTVRVSLVFGKKSLSGRFLVDSSATHHLVSPTWLRAQGINPSLVELRGEAPARYSWAGGRDQLGKRLLPLEVKVSDGEPLEIFHFLETDTELFGPPEFFGGCCDGVLGNEFLRRHVVEFKAGPPSAVVIYEAPGFSYGSKRPWIEASVSPASDIVSTGCAFTRAAVPGAAPPAPLAWGVRWDTGSEAAIAFHSPWTELASAARSPTDLDCGPEIKLMSPIPAREIESAPEIKTRVPSATLGAAFLGRGSVTFDLPHGRIWPDPAGLKLPIPINQTGIQLEFRLKSSESSERILRVKALDRKQSQADQLAREGLGVGTRVLRVDGVPADELDEWDIDQRLAGVYSKQVQLSWESAPAKGSKGAPQVAKQSKISVP